MNNLEIEIYTLGSVSVGIIYKQLARHSTKFKNAMIVEKFPYPIIYKEKDFFFTEEAARDAMKLKMAEEIKTWLKWVDDAKKRKITVEDFTVDKIEKHF